MAINVHDVGDRVKLQAVIKDSDGVAVDPTTIVLTVKPGEGTATNYTYAAGDLSRTAIGTYSMEYTIPSYSGGAYYYKFTVGGTHIGMEQSSFYVRVDDAA